MRATAFLLLACFACMGHGRKFHRDWSRAQGMHLRARAAHLNSTLLDWTPLAVKHLAMLLLAFNSHTVRWTAPALGQGSASLAEYRACLSMNAPNATVDEFSSGILPDGSVGGTSEDGRPVLRFRDSKTGVSVVLVGTMHWNPASIELAQRVVREESKAKTGLGTVMVELCPARWNRTKALMQPTTSKETNIFRWIYRDEFQAAFETARKCGISDVELVDQDYSQTILRVKNLSQLTAKQFLAGPAGWLAIGSDVRLALDELVAKNTGITACTPFSNPSLIAGIPLVLIRGVAANPRLCTMLAVGLLATGMLIDYAVPENPDTLIENVLQVLAVGDIGILLARVFLVAIIAERNFVLASNIRRACERSSRHGKDSVVAVLGMVHLNGVCKMLEE